MITIKQLHAKTGAHVRRADVTEASNLIHEPPVVTDDETARRSGSDAAALARQHGLTIDDAAYLELAMRRDTVLATDDPALGGATTAAGGTGLSD